MTTYNTGNPIGSTDARDRLDNSENMDILENSTTLTEHADRLGTIRKTRKGMEDEHDAQIAAHEAEFIDRILKMAFTPAGTFTAGATLTDARQTLLWEVSEGGDDHYYSWGGSFGTSGKVVTAGSTPSPIAAGSWVDRTDDALRDEIRETVFQNMKHQAAEAGYNLVRGSFEEGAVISGWPDVVWCQADGKYYQWKANEAKTVAVGSTPTNIGTDWIDMSGYTAADYTGRDLEKLILTNPSIDVSSLQTSDPVFILNAEASYAKMFALFCCNKTKAVLQEISNDYSSASDSDNIGSTSNTRLSLAYVVKDIIAGQLNPFASSNTVATTAVSQATWTAALSFPSTSGGTGYWKNGTYGLNNYISWNVGLSGYVEFYATSSSSITFYKSGASSSSVDVYTDSSLSGTYNATPTNISLVGSGVYVMSIVANSKVKIVNNTSSFCYVIGVDIHHMGSMRTDVKYDSIVYFREDAYTSGVAYWLGSSVGSNDFAFRSVDGRFFGSYHGGHTNETLSVSVDGVTHTQVSGKFSFGISATVKSISTLSDDSDSYSCESTMNISSDFTNVNIKLSSNSAVSENMKETFTAMSISNARFNYVTYPEAKLIEGTVGDEFELAPSDCVCQVDKSRGHAIITKFTQFDNRNASKSGPYVMLRGDDFKLYYNPSEDGSTYFKSINFGIIRHFKS